MSALDEVLEAYRDTFGVKTERANEIHRLACIEVAQLREGNLTMREADSEPREAGFKGLVKWLRWWWAH